MTTIELREEVVALRHKLYELERRLGGPGAATALEPGPLPVLTCRVGTGQVGLELKRVQRVVPIAKMAALPEAPPWVAGLLTVEDEVIPVIDLEARFARRSRRAELSDLVVILERQGQSVGLVVQEVFDVLQLRAEELEAPGGDLPQGPYLLGVHRLDEGVLLVVGLCRLLASSDIPELSDQEVGELAASPEGEL